MILRALVLMLFLSPIVEASSLREALTEGSVEIDLRYRFENVDDDAFAKDGNASTLRTTLTYRSARYRGFDILLAVEDVTDLGLDDDRGGMERPGIADPEITDFQQYALGYRLDEVVGVQLGRREINLGQQRYIGAVAWRQHHQSFDALQVDVETIPRTALTYVYLDRVHRIFGDDKPMGSHVLRAVIDVTGDDALELYGYELDYDRMVDAGLSTRTLGALWTGSAEIGDDWTLPYHLEFAQQDDSGDNPSDVDADYVRIQLDAKCKRGWLRAGFEELGSGFSTPLATLHKWNGWADRFLVTPPDGLEDLYFGIGTQRGSWKATVLYHSFEADSTDVDYGSEIDAEVSWKAPWEQLFALKFAAYDAEMFGTDVDKLWFYTAYRIGVAKN